MLADCLASVCLLDYPHGRIEAVVVDNGGAVNSRAAAEPYRDRLKISYLVNRQNRGYGYSVNRGIVAARGEVIALLNDDARPAPDVLRRCDALLESDPSIGAVGCRAIEAGYESWGTSIGVISTEGHGDRQLRSRLRDADRRRAPLWLLLLLHPPVPRTDRAQRPHAAGQAIQQRQSHRDRSLPHDPAGGPASRLRPTNDRDPPGQASTRHERGVAGVASQCASGTRCTCS